MNDRLKIRLTMLQEAAAQASQPGRPASSMERERRSVGLTEPIFSSTVSGARRIDGETLHAPGAELLAAGIASDLKAMMEPIEVAGGESAAPLRARLDATLHALPAFKGDCVAHADVAALASARRGGDDSLHLLVMDLHKALNHVAAAAAVEQIAARSCTASTMSTAHGSAPSWRASIARRGSPSATPGSKRPPDAAGLASPSRTTSARPTLM